MTTRHRRRNNKKKDNFWKYYKLYVISLSSFLLVALIVLWFSLLHYEKKHPYRVTIDFNQMLAGNTDAETSPGTIQKGYTIKAPSTIQISVDGNILTDNDIIQSEPIEELAFIDTLVEKFSEYNTLKEQINIPVMQEYYVETAYSTPIGIAPDGTECQPVFDADNNIYLFDLPEDTSMQEECSAFAMAFAKDYATFCANDTSSSTLSKYFPASSEYLRLISSVDNKYNAHSNLNFSNESVTEFKAYSDTLVYIHVEMDENMTLKSTGADFTYKVSLPIYIAKTNGQWIVINTQ